MNDTVEIYTTAEEAYDYSYCTSEETDMVYVTGYGKQYPIRKVTMPLDRMDYQTGRYYSGNHLAITWPVLQIELNFTNPNIRFIGGDN